MRVLMAPVNIAGQPMTVTTELRRLGVDASLLQYTAGQAGHRFGYGGDQFVDIKGRHRVEAQAEALEAALAAGYDIFHFWMSTFFGGRRYSNMYGLDLPFIKARGRRIVYRGTGFDLRVKSMHIARNPHHPFQHGYDIDIDEQAQRGYIKYLTSYVDQFIVQDPEMHEYMPQARVVPRGIEVDAITPVGIEPNDRPLIVHAPSKTLVKGTPILEQALLELGEEGHSFELKVIQDMDHQEAMDWYRRADVIVDQLLIGWYGVLTVEGLALGKPVVVYVRDDLYERFEPRIPIANANPDTVKDILRPLITDFAARRELAEHGPAFVREVHDVRRVAASLREIYEEVMERPVSQPDGYADLHHFVAQFKDVEALEERRQQKFRSAKYDELVEQLPPLRFSARRADGLARRVKELTDELRGARIKAAKYDSLSEELPGLRYKAKRADELAGEVQSLRYRARRADELEEETKPLRYKAARYDELQARARAKATASDGGGPLAPDSAPEAQRPS